jgi:hypothetical protein
MFARRGGSSVSPGQSSAYSIGQREACGKLGLDASEAEHEIGGGERRVVAQLMFPMGQPGDHPAPALSGPWPTDAVLPRACGGALIRAGRRRLPPLPRRLERASPQATSRLLGVRLDRCVAVRRVRVGQRPAATDHSSVQIDSARAAGRADDPVPGGPRACRLAADVGAADQIPQRSTRHPAAWVVLPAVLAQLIQVRRINPEQPPCIL